MFNDHQGLALLSNGLSRTVLWALTGVAKASSDRWVDELACGGRHPVRNSRGRRHDPV